MLPPQPWSVALLAPVAGRATLEQGELAAECHGQRTAAASPAATDRAPWRLRAVRRSLGYILIRLGRSVSGPRTRRTGDVATRP